MHGGKSVASALKLRTDYAMNPDKTENGKLISAFACDPHTADAEFLLAKRQYRQFTGRERETQRPDREAEGDGGENVRGRGAEKPGHKLPADTRDLPRIQSLQLLETLFSRA